jgi:hypothetical protein
MSKSELDSRDRVDLLASPETLLGCMKAFWLPTERI